jgi:hypothetical protein
MSTRHSRGLDRQLLSRRIFLRGAAGAALALPLLESLLPRGLRAQASVAPKRLIVMKSFSTQLIRKWYPSFTGNGYALKDSKYSDSKADGTTLLTQKLVSGQPYTWASLRDFQSDSGISAILGPKLNPYLDKLTLIRGLDFLPQVNHNYGGLLGNFSSCTVATACPADDLPDVPTIDQVLAYSSKFYPTAPAQRYLHITQGVVDSMSYSDGGQSGGSVQQLKARTNPLDVWNDLFAGVVAPGMSMQPAPNKDGLLIDKVLGQYKALRGNRHLSGEDKMKVDQYVNLIAELQAKLSVQPMLSCTRPAEPQSLANNNGTDPGDIKAKWDLFLDLVTAALMCDRTRIVTIGVHKALGPGPDPNDATLVGHFHSEDASGGTWHGLAHDFGNDNSRRMLQGINSWIAGELFAKLLEKLSVPEAGGASLLDNSLVYWGNELGFNHIGYSVPALLAGSAGGYIKTGRYLDYIDWDSRAYFSQEDGNVIQGIPHNRLLVTVLQAMGLAPADYERSGQPGYGSTSTAGKSADAWAVGYDLSQVGEVLPGIRAG